MESMDVDVPHLAYLEAAPTRDDPLFGGDYDAYRKTYKAWHKRQKLTKQGDAAPTGTAPKPRGRAPTVDGVACTWDEKDVCWRTASGARHDAPDKKKKAKKVVANKANTWLDLRIARQESLYGMSMMEHADGFITRVLQGEGFPEGGRSLDDRELLQLCPWLKPPKPTPAYTLRYLGQVVDFYAKEYKGGIMYY